MQQLRHSWKGSNEGCACNHITIWQNRACIGPMRIASGRYRPGFGTSRHVCRAWRLSPTGLSYNKSWRVSKYIKMLHRAFIWHLNLEFCHLLTSHTAGCTIPTVGIGWMQAGYTMAALPSLGLARLWVCKYMMTSWHGPLWRESIGHRWVPLTKVLLLCRPLVMIADVLKHK